MNILRFNVPAILIGALLALVLVLGISRAIRRVFFREASERIRTFAPTLVTLAILAIPGVLVAWTGDSALAVVLLLMAMIPVVILIATDTVGAIVSVPASVVVFSLLLAGWYSEKDVSGPVGEVRPGAWSAYREPGSIEGLPHIWAATSTDEETRLLPVTLMIICKGPRLVVTYSPGEAIRREVGDSTHSYFLERPADLSTRFDSDPSSQQQWTPTSDAIAFLPPDPVGFVRELQAAAAGVEIGLADTANGTKTDTFPITGFEEATSVLHCIR